MAAPLKKAPTSGGFPAVAATITETGLVFRGGFALPEDERRGPLAGVGTIVLVGMAGRDGWPAFAASAEAQDGRPDPLDRFSRRVISVLAHRFGAVALFPFEGPPYHPFQQWAARAEPVHPSPLGLLIHPVLGLWHSYRGALGLREGVGLPIRTEAPSPCAACAERPCLRACPVGAFSSAGYDVAVCDAHLGSPAGADCMEGGCLARRACPVGVEHRHGDEHAAFTMRAFLARPGLSGRGGPDVK